MFGNMMGGSAASQADSQLEMWETLNRTGLQISLNESPGILNKVLNIFTSNKVNLTRISSKPRKFTQGNWREIDFMIDIEGDIGQEHVQKAIRQLNLVANHVTEIGTPEVPWFPTRIEDFNIIGKRVLGEGDGIQSADHPGFRDPEYRKRREYIATVA